MALSWKLLDYMSGMVIRSEGLPVSDESAEVAIDIHGEDSAELDINREELTADENNSWRETFALLLRGVALDDDSKSWDDPTAISFSGFINKLNDDINPRKIKAQITGPTEYTKGRIVADTWAPVSDPTTTVDFTGSNWAEVMANAFIKCFSSDGIPAGKPKPYNILGKIQYADGTLITPTGSTVTKSVKVTDAMTYHDLLTSISDEAGGLEWRMVTRWIDSTRLQAVVDVTIGTEAVPHIKEDVTLSLDLAENDAKFSAYSGTFDSNELYSKLYIQSVSGDTTTKDGADFSVASVDDTEFPVLFERFFNPGVALTPEEKEAQLTARLSFAAKPKYETSITVEEKFDPAEWIAHLGKKLTLTGVADTPSAGHDAVVRIVGITFTPGKGTIKAQLMQLGPTYPRLPKDRLQNLSGYNGNSLPVPSLPTGGGVTPTPLPTPTGVGVDGVPSLGNAWGDQGRNPWDGKPDKITNPDLADYKDITTVYSDYDGESVLHPYTACQNDGNRIYGLDHAAQVAGTTYTGTTATHYSGGVDWRTGAPLDGWKPFYINKTYIVNGEMGPIDTVGVITADQIKAMVAPYNRNMAYGNEDSNYETSIMSVNWIIDGRFYFGLATLYRTKIGAGPWQPGQTASNSYYGSSVSIISSNMTAEGTILGDWRNEKADFPNYGFPMTPFISRAGKIAAFTQFYQVPRREFTDATYQSWVSWQQAVTNQTGWGPLDCDLWISPFGDALMWQNKPGAWQADSNIPGMDWGLGSLWKNYSTIDSPFQPYAGFNTGTQNKKASGGVAHMAFASDGSLYGIHRWASLDIKKLGMTDSGVATGAWQTVRTVPEDGSYFTNLAIVKDCAYWGESPGNGTFSAKLLPLSGTSVKSITTAPYKDFPFNDSQGSYIAYDLFNGRNDNAHMNGNGIASKIFSYDGRLYNFKLVADANGAKNTIILHSMQVVQAAA